MFVLVMAKAPVPGRVKTRLCPPCTPEQASDIATAALADTLDAVIESRADEVVVALDGEPGPWLPDGVHVIPQAGSGFDQRLTAAWRDTWDRHRCAGIQIGMDTPQVTPELLDRSMDRLASPGTDAVLGPAADGGWWAIGLHRAHDRVFVDVPMSTESTGADQLARLRSLELRVESLPEFVDVDHFAEAQTVAATMPGTRFADAVARAMADSATDVTR